MTTPLDPLEIRVLGALVEKELSTPDAYPLSLASLTAACNQKSNRDPVLSLDEATVQEVVDALLKKHLVRERGTAGGRVPKFAHRLSSSLDDPAELSRAQLAVMAELMLRGPQTAGELRTRTARMHGFDDFAAVETVLLELATRDPEPYVAELPRQPGQREQRYMQLLGGDAPPAASAAAPATRDGGNERLLRLEAEVDALRSELAELRERLSALEGG